METTGKPKLLFIERDKDFVVFEFSLNDIVLKLQGFEEIVFLKNQKWYFLHSVDIDGSGRNSIGKNIYMFKNKLGREIALKFDVAKVVFIPNMRTTGLREGNFPPPIILYYEQTDIV